MERRKTILNDLAVEVSSVRADGYYLNETMVFLDRPAETQAEREITEIVGAFDDHDEIVSRVRKTLGV